ncbi:HsdR family type I site-specific deoxyribonuclease, partial [Cereibacter sphaeroides]
TDRPCDTNTSTCRSFATISSGLCFFWGIPASSIRLESLPQGGPLFWGQTTLTADSERFMPWRTTDGEVIAAKGQPELQVLIEGIFDRRRLLDLLHDFTVFGETGSGLAKIIAGYHQFHAVMHAVEQTVEASAPQGDRKVGVIWHTQGSGKSLLMAFYAGQLVQHPKLENPTIVVITDRNDLDDQLFGTFSMCRDLIRQTPIQADSRDDLQAALSRASGGVIFTTIQKFSPATAEATYPMLSDRRNIVVIADEAHRSQYGFRARIEHKTGEVAYGFAKYRRDALPNASFIGFTGTPIEKDDVNTPAVFGEYIDVYDISRAVEDGATVPIYYESRLARIEIPDEEKPKIDAEIEELTEDEATTEQERIKRKWATVEALVGSEKRLAMDSDQRQAGIDEAEAVAVLLEKYEVVKAMYHGFDYARGLMGTPQERLVVLAEAIEWILGCQHEAATKESNEDGKRREHRRYQDAVLALSKAFALASASDEARNIREEVGFFQAVRAALVKSAANAGKSAADREFAIQQILDRAVVSTEIVDILAAAGITTPDISILSDEFLAEVLQLEKKNLALEALRKLLNDEIRSRSKANVVETKRFSERLEAAIARYHTNAISTVEVLQELIDLAKEVRAARRRGQDEGLSQDEIAFYDALAENESAVELMGNDSLKVIAHELLVSLKGSVSVDWSHRESARARMRVLVKRILRKHGFPPDLQDAAVQTVLRQAEALSSQWAV